jgi:hypothetical protein
MLNAFKGKISARKLRLFACAACRRLWPFLRDERSRTAVVISERYADGLVDEAELLTAWADAEEAVRELQTLGRGMNAAQTAAMTTQAPDEAAERAAIAAAYDADMLRHICGNPFRRVSIDPAWLVWNDGSVAKMAQSIYEDRLFEDMPILADALEQAGCDNADLLDHCRAPGVHMRGCWLLDLLLAKA